MDDVQLVDVTLRDGGKVNGHCWTTGQAVSVVESCVAAGVPVVEAGYFRPALHGAGVGAAAYCPAGYLRSLLAAASGRAALAVMVSRADAAPRDLAALAACGVTTVTMSARPGDVAGLGPYAEAAHEAGLGLVAKVMRVNRLPDDALLRAAQEAEAAGADVFYLADSYGAMFPEDVTRLAARLAEVTEAPLGLHAHDGLSLAFANCVAAVRAGFTYIDASLSGMGVDGGNLSLELAAAYLRVHAGQNLAITPLARVSATLLTPWLGEGAAVREAVYAVIGLLDLDPADATFPAPADFLTPGNADALLRALDDVRVPPERRG